MLGRMTHKALTISSLVEHAARYHGDTNVISVDADHSTVRTSWKQVEARSRKLAAALTKAGMKTGDRCATIAWSNHRHLELYFGVSGSGLVCHTVNPRLFPEQITYIFNHAADRILFVDETFLPMVAELKAELKTVERIIVMSARNKAAELALSGVEFYEEFLETGDEEYIWPELDENHASSLCYTSGTTGHPKGVLYSHRSTVLHTLAAAHPDSLNISARDIVLPVASMFHANAWGVPYVAAMTGARLILPGRHLDGESLVALINEEQVSVGVGVPTIWTLLLEAADKSVGNLDSLKRVVIGGSACPPSIIERFRNDYQVEAIHAWGMTEVTAIGTINSLKATHCDLSEPDQNATRMSQGRPQFGMEIEILDNDGVRLTHDGRASGNLQVRGHWVISSYFGADESAQDKDGWFATGDVASIDPGNYMTIRDRSKDIIKSGGEWISSVELEGIAFGHPKLSDAAVIGARHPKWDERPVLLAVKSEGECPEAAEILNYFDGKIASWQKPDAVIFLDEIPRNPTGKIMKLKLRETYSGVLESTGQIGRIAPNIG